MLELSKNRYEVLFDPVMEIPFNMLMARSVISDHTSGRIFVDSCENPKSFYIVHPYGMTYLCGHSGNDEFNIRLFNYFKDKSFARKKTNGFKRFPVIGILS